MSLERWWLIGVTLIAVNSKNLGDSFSFFTALAGVLIASFCALKAIYQWGRGNA